MLNFKLKVLFYLRHFLTQNLNQNVQNNFFDSHLLWKIQYYDDIFYVV